MNLWSSLKPRLMIIWGLTLAAFALSIGMARYGGVSAPYLIWAGLILVAPGLLLLLAIVAIATGRKGFGLTLLICAVMALFATYLTRTAVAIAQKLRLERHQSDYVAQISTMPVVQGQRVAAFPWSDGRVFGPSYLLYDEGNTLYREIDGALPSEWRKQAEKTIVAKSCNVAHLDVYRIANHFYVVGCEDQFD